MDHNISLQKHALNFVVVTFIQKPKGRLRSNDSESSFSVTQYVCIVYTMYRISAQSRHLCTFAAYF